MIEGIKLLRSMCERKLKIYVGMYCGLKDINTNYKQWEELERLENELVLMMLLGYKNYIEKQQIKQQKETEKQIEEFTIRNLFSARMTD